MLNQYERELDLVQHGLLLAVSVIPLSIYSGTRLRHLRQN